jgi:acetyl-CoA acetyltransferase
VYGDSTCGQRAVYDVGLTGIPVFNVNNNCSTGSSALWLARQAVASGAAECVLAVGFEQMAPGALGAVYTDRPGPLSRLEAERDDILGGDDGSPTAARFFGGAGQAYADEFCMDPSIFALIAVKAR